MEKGNKRRASQKAVKNVDRQNSDPWSNQEIHIVDSVEKCRDVVKQLRLYVNVQRLHFKKAQFNGNNLYHFQTL